MLISTDQATNNCEAHNSVVDGVYLNHNFGPGKECDTDPAQHNDCSRCNEHCDPTDASVPEGCVPSAPPERTPIGYEPAWQCLLGSGGLLVNRQPQVDAGPDRTVECQGHGGATVTLPGSAIDPDCDVLDLLWSGPFGAVAVDEAPPEVFLPLGTN